ncbi:MAG: endonuclease/exonuclease/phosphatase family protein [Sphingobacteriales bacterium]|jgi:endonuclease/exonuclease/phosphatase family metal-dependent hydrolase|nr:endonuclease/exonuclease/phosphatase family protein [Sphingobacteriales bacterium]
MNKLFFAIVIFFIGTTLSAQDLNVMTFNLRYNNPGDSLNAWPHRKDKAASEILFHDVDYLGVQEALEGQMKALLDRLPGYQSIGGGRDDGKTKGEYSAIFYNTKRLKPLKTGMFWLSETPAVPGSKSWDAAITRMVTWAKFKDLKTGKIFFAFNTHFDHIGKEARRQSAHLLLKKVKVMSGATPAIITGDFNAEPMDEPIVILKDPSNPLHLIDAMEISQMPHYGPTGTFNNFKRKEVNDYPIDYIFLKGNWKVKKHASISQTWGGRFASDHFAVFAVLAY